MKRKLIVTYDLKEPDGNYEDVLKLVKSYGEWAKLGGSSYLILTTATPVEVRDKIKTAMRKGDKLYVGVAPGPSAWTGMPDEVATWIHEH